MLSNRSFWSIFREYWHQRALAVRDAYRELYQHYKLERERIEHAAVHRTHGDAAILSAMHRAQEDQRQQSVERQVRRYYEASRFVTPREK